MFSLHHPIRRGGFTCLRRVQKDIWCKALTQDQSPDTLGSPGNRGVPKTSWTSGREES